MGRKFVISMLSVMIIFTAFISGFFMIMRANAFPVDDYADVYAVVGDKKILLSHNDAHMVKKLFKTKYDRGYGGKCPFDFGIGFEIGNYRYLIAMDGCNSIDMYSLDGEFLYGGGNPWGEEYVSKYFYKYFDDDDIREYFWGDNFTYE